MCIGASVCKCVCVCVCIHACVNSSGTSTTTKELEGHQQLMVLCESLLVAVLGGSCLIVGSTPPRPSGTPESSCAGEREYEIEREH